MLINGGYCTLLPCPSQARHATSESLRRGLNFYEYNALLLKVLLCLTKKHLQRVLLTAKYSITCSAKRKVLLSRLLILITNKFDKQSYIE